MELAGRRDWVVLPSFVAPSVSSAGLARRFLIKSLTRSFEIFFRSPGVDSRVLQPEGATAVVDALRGGGSTESLPHSFKGPSAGTEQILGGMMDVEEVGKREKEVYVYRKSQP